MTLAALLLVLAVQDSIEDESYQYLEEGAIQQALEETLAQPEFARLRTRIDDETNAEDAPDWLLRFFRWLADLLAGNEADEDRTVSRLPPLVRVPILVGVLLLVVLFLAKALWSARRRRSSEAEIAPAAVIPPGAVPGEIDPEEYWRRALEHGKGRRYRDGIRELLLGAMSAAERRGSIRYRRGLTNRDYLHAMRGGARLSFGNIASAFEQVYFGRREATPESYRECCREFQKGFRGSR